MQPLYTQYTTFATPQIPNTQRSQLIATYRSVVSPTHAQLQGPDAQLQKKKKHFNILCKGSALRYLLTRSYDYLNTPKSAVIKIKNPREYIQKLKVHNKFNNFKNYYN